ncbi:MAG: hypothetical protein EB117_12865 [Betaproteobacteria bacterium]|nr:hypothetical protein [Betaproteobacteria bacterium]
MPSLISNETEIRAALKEFFDATAKVSALIAAEYVAKAWEVQTVYDDSECKFHDSEPYTETKMVSIKDLDEGRVRANGCLLWLESNCDLAEAEVMPSDIEWMQAVGRAHELLGYITTNASEMSETFAGKPIETPKLAPEPDHIGQLILNYLGVSREAVTA